MGRLVEKRGFGHRWKSVESMARFIITTWHPPNLMAQTPETTLDDTELSCGIWGTKYVGVEVRGGEWNDLRNYFDDIELGFGIWGRE